MDSIAWVAQWQSTYLVSTGSVVQFHSQAQFKVVYLITRKAREHVLGFAHFQ
jgi:hypothetical protein